MTRNVCKNSQSFIPLVIYELVRELEESAELPKGKEVDFLYAEADGVFIRGTEKKKSYEVGHAIIYANWMLTMSFKG